jgi:hypothetical protein
VKKIALAAAAVAAALSAYAGAVGAATTSRAADLTCGVTQNCIKYRTVVVGPTPYLNVQVTVCKGTPDCAQPDVSAGYAGGESDVDVAVDADSTYYLVVGQAHGVDSAVLSHYITVISCSYSGAGTSTQLLSSGSRQIALPIPHSTSTLVSCTITDSYAGPKSANVGHAKKSTTKVKKKH